MDNGEYSVRTNVLHSIRSWIGVASGTVIKYSVKKLVRLAVATGRGVTVEE